ncbi:hypothetical protein RCL1_006786 [Eukaryota sp. TZLM3-RCL]
MPYIIIGPTEYEALVAEASMPCSKERMLGYLRIWVRTRSISNSTNKFICDALEPLGSLQDVTLNSTKSSITFKVESQEYIMQRSPLSTAIHLKTPGLNTPFIDSKAVNDLTDVLVEYADPLSIIKALNENTVAVVPVIAGHGLGKTRLLLQIALSTPNFSTSYFSFGRFDNVDSFPNTLTEWKSIVDNVDTVDKGMLCFQNLFLTCTNFDFPKNKDYLVEKSIEYHRSYISSWRSMSNSIAVSHVQDFEELWNKNLPSFTSVPNRNHLIALDEVDALLGIQIDTNFTAWDCLLMCVQRLQFEMVQHHCSLVLVCAMLPSSILRVRRYFVSPQQVRDLPIIPSTLQPITSLYFDEAPTVFSNQHSYCPYPALPLGTMLQSRPKWIEYAKLIAAEELLNFSPNLLTPLHEQVEKYLLTCCPLPMEHYELWVASAISYLVLPSITSVGSADNNLMFSNVSLLNFDKEHDSITLYRPPDVLLANSIWNILNSRILPEDFHEKNVKLTELLLGKLLSTPAAPCSLGLSLELVSILLLIRQVHSLMDQNQTFLGVVSASVLLESLGPTCMNDNNSVVTTDASIFDHWWVGCVQALHIDDYENIVHSDPLQFARLLVLAFVHRCVIVPPPRTAGVDLIIPIVHQSLVEELSLGCTNGILNRTGLLERVSFIDVQVKSYAKLKRSSATEFRVMFNNRSKHFKKHWASILVNFGPSYRMPQSLRKGPICTIWTPPDKVVNLIKVIKEKENAIKQPISVRYKTVTVRQQGVSDSISPGSREAQELRSPPAVIKTSEDMQN